ncbi:MAG TPA: hypothetical protein VMC09_15000 [Anaerolineales bacterium]|nr:hypothetical protein [Anaerolineales bacterium]
MSIQIFSPALYLGEVSTEHGQLGWINTFASNRIGRVEIDWGDDEDADHLAYVYRGEECIANILLDRYLPNEGQIMRRDSKVGKIVYDSPGAFAVYRGDKLVGKVKSSGETITSKHLILFGGGGAVVLLGI